MSYCKLLDTGHSRAEPQQFRIIQTFSIGCIKSDLLGNQIN
jgi:hypothetical protein